MENDKIQELESRLNELEAKFRNHAHTGVDSQNILLRNIVPTYVMSPAQLSTYLAKPAVNGDAFTVYNGSDYILYYYINGNWKAAPFP